MNFYEIVRISLRSIRVNKMRSFLTMLGIIIGVASVIAMISIGQGASSSVAKTIEGLGSNLLIVTPGQATQGNVRMGSGSLDTLTMSDVQSIQKLSSVSGVAPDITKSGQVSADNQSYTTTIEGTTPDALQVRNLQVASGSFLANYQVKGEANVAVLGPTVVENLFPRGNPVGRTVEINGIPFTVVGVLQSQGNEGATNNDDRIIIPITTGMDRIFNTTHPRTIYVSAKSANQMNAAQLDIETTMRSSHNLVPGASDDFTISSQDQILSTATSVDTIMTALLGGAAAISLIVGGIGIMNIMLVSVTERTREIGIRKAIGASKGKILLQFLIEAVVLSVMSGIIGIVLGFGASYSIGKFTTMTTSITLSPILYAFFFSLVIGIVFGVYPARKAASLNPIDALRYE